MKNILLILLMTISSLSLMAHENGHGTPIKDWTLELSNKVFQAEFVKYESNSVWLRDQSHRILRFKLSDFSEGDQKHIVEKQNLIQSINTKEQNVKVLSPLVNLKKWLLLFGGILLIFFVFKFFKQKKLAYTLNGTLIAMIIVFISCGSNDDSENSEPEQTIEVPPNDTSFMQSIFESFEGVSTFSNDTYFYIASNGLPNHNMMVGITNWQQQVPIDHNYTGNNSWAIPIQPELAENPLSTQTNLLKGAIAVAVNGIPVFNPLNNRGEDANVIGELDQWGGHCGRADDYHYHLPPTHLQAAVGDGMPIAYAVDGFPVYGETTDTLDEYLGKFNDDGSYQYHTISEYPYFIAGMRGEVILDPNTTAPENQVIPQALTQELRPALEPLNGAEINDFQSTGTNSYSLTYVLNSESYMVNYSWNENAFYTYEFISPDGTSVVETYQR